MLPTFLQKRRATGPALRLGFALIALVLLLIGCVVALSMIIVDRDITTLDKVVFISGMLLGFLLGTGLLARFRR